MKKFILAFAATTLMVGGAYAQQGTPLATESEQDATTVSAEQQAEDSASTTLSNAPQSGPLGPTATEAERDATTAAQTIVPETGSSAPLSGADAPTATESETDATTVQVN